MSEPSYLYDDVPQSYLESEAELQEQLRAMDEAEGYDPVEPWMDPITDNDPPF